MLQVNMEDVMSVLRSIRPHLIGFAIVLVLAIGGIIFSRLNKKMTLSKRYMVKMQSILAIFLALVVVVNLITVGPMSTLIDLATGEGNISQESIEQANDFGVRVAEEGIVLLKNDQQALPLDSNSKVNVFGWASTNPCYGGSGSGGISDAYPKITLLEGLKDAGIQTNQELSDFYQNYRSDRPEVTMFGQDWTLPEPPVDSYSNDLLENAKAFSDTAIVVISRTGCENADLPMDLSKVNYTNNSDAYEDFGSDRHYLELSKSEEDMVKMVAESYAKVIVVYNGASVFELGFCDDYDSIESVLWCPSTGQTGFKALGEIVTGQINPSGKTSDIFVKDLTQTPSFNNFKITNYSNMDDYAVETTDFMTGEKSIKKPSFVDYVENIYVGYRFYETAAEEGFLDYDQAVLYPFGYGLSYTQFKESIEDMQTDNDGNITVTVNVDNQGQVAGKEVVEIYYNPPYENGGIEKSSSNLIGFAKTDLLNPGQQTTVTITFNQEDMASYDDQNEKAYVLDAGDYVISLNDDSHHVIDKEIYSVPSKVTYNEGNKRSSDAELAENQFDFARGDVTYLSRQNAFENYEVACAKPTSTEMNQESKALYLDNQTYNPSDYNNADDSMPVTGAKNNVVLSDLRGKTYEDPLWSDLLDQLTISEMDDLIALGGYQTKAIPSIGKVSTLDCDGPVDIYNNFTGVSSIGLPSMVMLACSFSEPLAYEYGSCIGKMADEMNISGWYAPSMNMHRSAFAGRNFEYYSEDGFLAGKMAANEVKGAAEHGVYAYIKHFALNDQETDRWYKNSMWSTEQAIREVYLKPFEMAVKEGQAKAVMSSYNYIGPYWSGGCGALLQDVLRNEWGFRGMVITDYFLAIGGAMNADQAIRNGSDLMLTNIEAGTNHIVDQQSATGVLAMRNATHNILYTVVNSRVYEGNTQNQIAKWKILLIIIDVIALFILLAIEWLIVRKKYLKLKK